MVNATQILGIIGDKPTAPFFEHHLVDTIDSILDGRMDLDVEKFPDGTIVVSNKPNGKDLQKIAFTAHLDHPGFLLSPLPNGSYAARLEGGFNETLCKDARLELHNHVNLESTTGRIVEQLDSELYRVKARECGNWSFARPKLPKFSMRGNIIKDLYHWIV